MVKCNNDQLRRLKRAPKREMITKILNRAITSTFALEMGISVASPRGTQGRIAEAGRLDPIAKLRSQQTNGTDNPLSPHSAIVLPIVIDTLGSVSVISSTHSLGRRRREHGSSEHPEAWQDPAVGRTVLQSSADQASDYGLFAGSVGRSSVQSTATLRQESAQSELPNAMRLRQLSYDCRGWLAVDLTLHDLPILD